MMQTEILRMLQFQNLELEKAPQTRCGLQKLELRLPDVRLSQKGEPLQSAETKSAELRLPDVRQRELRSPELNALEQAISEKPLPLSHLKFRATHKKTLKSSVSDQLPSTLSNSSQQDSKAKVIDKKIKTQITGKQISQAQADNQQSCKTQASGHQILKTQSGDQKHSIKVQVQPRGQQISKTQSGDQKSSKAQTQPSGQQISKTQSGDQKSSKTQISRQQSWKTKTSDQQVIKTQIGDQQNINQKTPQTQICDQYPSQTHPGDQSLKVQTSDLKILKRTVSDQKNAKTQTLDAPVFKTQTRDKQPVKSSIPDQEPSRLRLLVPEPSKLRVLVERPLDFQVLNQSQTSTINHQSLRNSDQLPTSLLQSDSKISELRQYKLVETDTEFLKCLPLKLKDPKLRILEFINPDLRPYQIIEFNPVSSKRSQSQKELRHTLVRRPEQKKSNQQKRKKETIKKEKPKPKRRKHDENNLVVKNSRFSTVMSQMSNPHCIQKIMLHRVPMPPMQKAVLHMVSATKQDTREQPHHSGATATKKRQSTKHNTEKSKPKAKNKARL